MLLEQLKKRVPGLEPVAAAGLSLGEFTAHAAAGTFSFEEQGASLLFVWEILVGNSLQNTIYLRTRSDLIAFRKSE